MKHRIYKAKLLLFGEYTIIQGFQALAMPLDHFRANWVHRSVSEQDLNRRKFLLGLADYLEKLNDQIDFKLEVANFKTDLASDLYFESNIPIGYGVGSSGALTAAVYDRYIKDTTDLKLEILKSRLALIESFFHGSSSGIDPLICYLDQTVLMESKTKIKTVQLNTSKESIGSIFLLNTGIPRKTEPLVEIFLQKCKDEYFQGHCQSELSPLNDDAIDAFLKGDWKELFQTTHEISYFQYKYFAPMIPKNIQQIWLDGLSNSLFKLKLCGAGGGGFMLGFTEDMEKTKLAINQFPIKEVCKV